MDESLLEIKIDGHSLLAVPAVHYRVPFAEQVNQICGRQDTRPDAIAVELGPGGASAVANLLTELGVGPDRAAPLPCMLGLIRINNRIHPKLKSIAIRLQEVTGKHLHEINPSLLCKHLKFSAVSMLPISPTDSIIEAIRCALELGVPLYGVDMEEFASAERIPLMIQDPAMASRCLADYVLRNVAFGEKGRDATIDGRPELVIAAQLKALMQQHRRVLFTGGLGHWTSLQALLSDKSVRPAVDVPTTSTVQYHRVLVHPLLAASQMEIFPEVTAWYQRRRQPANCCRTDADNLVDFQLLFRALLKRTYKDFFRTSDDEPQLGRKPEDYQNLPQFERLLANVCAVGLRMVPSLFNVLEVAALTMSPNFCRALADVFMDYDWASPSDWPELPIVGPDPVLEGEISHPEGSHRAVMIIPTKDRAGGKENTTYQTARPFYISCLPEGEGRKVSVKNPWQWNHEPKKHVPSAKWGQPRVWPPDDFLLFGTAFQAGQVANNRSNERQSEPFEGSLLDGIDFKETLRSSIRGEARIYVRRNPLVAELKETRQSILDPTAFIFDPPRDGDSASWYLYHGSMTWNHREHIKDQNRFNEVVRLKGDDLIEGVGFVQRASVPKRLASFVAQLNILRGIVVFGPCLNAIQEAKWLEDTDYARAPIFDGGQMEGLISMFQERHRMHLDPDDWITTLIRFAIPYARRRVIVIAPDHFVLSPIIFQEARARRIHIAVVPLSYFPSERIEKVTRQYIVYPEDKDGLRYSRELQRLLGESVNAYSEMLPRHLLQQGVIDRG